MTIARSRVNHLGRVGHLWGVVTMTLEAGFATAVVERAAQGDQAAFARLVAAYHADLVRVAYVTCGDRDLAQDAVQSAWTIAWRKLATIRDPAKVKGWLVATAANEARQLCRRQMRGRVTELKLQAPSAPRDDPGELIDRVDLVDALSHLTPEDRSLLALRYVAGLDSTELGDLLHMSPSGTRARIARLLARLRRELDHG